jgi:Flp pilus assembly protein TadD
LSAALAISDKDAATLTLAAIVALESERVSDAEGLIRHAIAIKPGEGKAQAVLALLLRHQGDATSARNAAELAVTFAPTDAEIAAVAKWAGAQVSKNMPAPATLPRTTPAKTALADCVAALDAGNPAGARGAGAGWSLCHLAAVQRQ